MNDSNPSPAERRTIRVGALARVEGEGALHVVMRGAEVEEVRLDIYEPPRFFEALLVGRDFREVPDITARICGICPVAYQMSSCQALERALGVADMISPQIRSLRDLLYCGEWIESHVLHMFLLHLPDFLGFASAIEMAGKHPDLVKRALRIKKLGNQIVTTLGGRAVHPVGACVGGFHRAPEPQAIAALIPELGFCLDDMCELTLFLASSVKYPRLERDYEFVALCPDSGYPMNDGRIRSNKGLDVSQEEFDRAVEERHVPHSNALHAVIRGRGTYVVGPLARLNLNHERLHPRAAEVLLQTVKATGARLPWRNGYLGLAARAVETVHALALASDIAARYVPPAPSHIEIQPREGAGSHGTEAPRGICWHHYRTTADGSIAAARIITPTGQNLASVEQDLRELLATLSQLPDEEASLRCEHLIRNYDPCISCSVHFLEFVRRNMDQPH